MSTVFKDDFVDRIEARGEARGRAAGEARGEATALLRTARACALVNAALIVRNGHAGAAGT
jgi:hypothetical protein